MISNRALYEHERYFRAADGTVNLASSPAVPFTFGPRRANEVYVVPSLFLTLAGPGLLTNLHQFGGAAGSLALEHQCTDSLGVSYEALSGTVLMIGGREDWVRGRMTGTTVRAELGEAGAPRSPEVVVADAKASTLAWAPDVLSYGPPLAMAGASICWTSSLVSIVGLQVVYIAWDIQDAVDKQFVEQRKYRVDVRFLNRNPALDQSYCLTHWDNAGAAPGDPAPLAPPPAAGPLGAAAVDSAFRTKGRSMGAVDPDAEALSVTAYFDITDALSAQQSNLEDFLRRPPFVVRCGVYARFRPHPSHGQAYDPAVGRRQAGVFASLRELLETAGDLGRASTPGGYNNDDIAFVRLPLSCQLQGRTQDCLRATFAGNGLSLFEVRAEGAALNYVKP